MCQDDENPDIEVTAFDIYDYVQLLHYMALMMICTDRGVPGRYLYNIGTIMENYT